jgi:uncharacterized membrane protein YidH (DUF202 family)
VIERGGSASAERTRLAWRRTVLAVTVVAVLNTRLALVGGSPIGPAVAAAGLIGWLAVLATTFRRIQAMAAAQPVPVGRVLPLAAGAAAGYAVLAALLVLTGS